jgi:cytochrome c oxidase cbb3-type subunit 1
MKCGAEIVVVSVGAFLALLGAGFAADDLFRSHMWMLFFVLAAGAISPMRGTSFAQARVGAKPSGKYKIAVALTVTMKPCWSD